MIVIGLRGARAVEPENTLRAIRTGMACADYVEIDLRLSRDRVPVVIHDPTFDRTTNGSGPVSGLALRELKKLDAGCGEQVPTLAEVCDEIHDRCGLFAEIKEPGPKRSSAGHSAKEAPAISGTSRSIRRASWR